MAASDATYDRRFIVGVRSTGIYCLPSCRAKLPKPENVVFYETVSEARAAGLRPCKRCRPDEAIAGIDPELDRLESVVKSVRSAPSRFKGVDDVAIEAAMSPSQLFATLRSNFGTTPGALLASGRIDLAQELIRTTNRSIGEIGMEVGFETTSAFYENFGKRTGMPPAAYRKLRQENEFTLDLPEDIPTGHLLRFLGRDPEGLTERPIESGFQLGLWAGAAPSQATVVRQGSRVRVQVASADGSPDIYVVLRQVSGLLGLTSDPRPFEDHVRSLGLERLVAGREGTRIPLSPSPFDGVVWSIVGQQVNLTFAATLRRRLTERTGFPLGNGMYAPPRAADVAKLEPDELVPLQFSRRKAEYLIGVARTIDSGELDLEALARSPLAKMESTLLSLRGVGPWSANYLMLRALGAPDCLPLGDTGLTSALAKFFDVPRPGPAETQRLMEPFRPYRSLATYHLWHFLHLDP